METTHFRRIRLETPTGESGDDYLSRLATSLAGLHVDNRSLQAVRLDDQQWTIVATMSEDVSLLPAAEQAEVRTMVQRWLESSFGGWDVIVEWKTCRIPPAR